MEFVLGLLMIFSFFFFFIRMSAIFAVGNYIHYATFMAARAYSSGTQGPDEQELRAKEVLDATVTNRFKSLVRAKSDAATIGGGAYYQEDAIRDFWNQGVSYHFKAKLTLYPITTKGQSIDMDLTSESWMPRNPSVKECEAQRDGLSARTGIPGVKVEWDNGC